MAQATFHLETEILKEHSKAQCEKIVAWVGNNPKRFDKLLRLCLRGEPVVGQRASWPLSYVAIANPGLLKNSLGILVDNLENPGLHNAVKRHTVRILENIPIPKKLEGRVMNIGFDFLQSPTEPIAVKAFSLTILGKLAQSYPEIIPEIKLLIEELPNQTPAFKSRAKHLLKSFSSLKGFLLQDTDR